MREPLKQNRAIVYLTYRRKSRRVFRQGQEVPLTEIDSIYQGSNGEYWNRRFDLELSEEGISYPSNVTPQTATPVKRETSVRLVNFNGHFLLAARGGWGSSWRKCERERTNPQCTSFVLEMV